MQYTKNYNARAQLLCCSFILLFSSVAAAIAVVDFLSSLKSLLLLGSDLGRAILFS